MIWNSLTGLLGKLADAYAARAQAQDDATRAAADVQIAALQGRLASRDNRGLQWAVAIVALSMAIHIAAVVVASMIPALGWVVHALPPPMNEWQGSIILSMFGLAAVGRFFR